MIQIEHLTKDYEDFHLDISLSVLKGHITGLIGRNGAGKSTTIKAILGLIKADGGTAKTVGKDAMSLNASDRQKLGVALSDSSFSGYLTLKEITDILQALYKNFDKAFFISEIKKAGLPLNKQLKEFSTGMKAKVRVLVAISHKARLLVLDEPTVGLDVIARNEILDLLRDYVTKDEERSILVTSHISSDLEGLCDDIYLIHDGKVILHEDTDVLLDNYAIVKIDSKTYEQIDQQYLLKVQKTDYGYQALTSEKQYYLDNYPGLVIEKNSIDELIVMMTKQEAV